MPRGIQGGSRINRPLERQRSQNVHSLVGRSVGVHKTVYQESSLKLG